MTKAFSLRLTQLCRSNSLILHIDNLLSHLFRHIFSVERICLHNHPRRWNRLDIVPGTMVPGEATDSTWVGVLSET